MKHKNKHWVRSILAGAVAFASLTMHAAPAAAHGGCWGAGCTGRDPQAMGCSNDAYTIATNSTSAYYGLVVELRYSPSCNAKWSRVFNHRNDVAPLTTSYLGWGQNTRKLGIMEGRTWSLMWSGYATVRACGQNHYRGRLNGRPFATVCTRYM